MRNCGNRLRLSADARSVQRYTNESAAEHQEKGARKVWVLGDLRLYECPLTYLTRETAEIMGAVRLIRDTGVLLFDGGWAGQPAWLVETAVIAGSDFASRTARRKDG